MANGLLFKTGATKRVLLATGMVAKAEMAGKTFACMTGIAGGDSDGSTVPSTAANVGSKRKTGFWLVAGVVDDENEDEVMGPDGESSKAGERRRVLVFLATLFGEEVPKSLGADSAKVETLAVFLLLVILNAADIVEELENFVQ
jgi:hypothetical protein